MAHAYQPAIRGRKLACRGHCSAPTPDDIAFDATLSLDDRLECLLDWRNHLRTATRGEPPPAWLVELGHVVEAIQVVTAAARSTDDWEHYMHPSVFAGSDG